MDEELIQKLKDPKYYLENFCKIKVKKGGLAPFIFNEAQKDLCNTLNSKPRVAINKARQLGISTLASGWIYHQTITTPGILSALVGYNSDLTAELLDKIKTFWRTTPPRFRPTIKYNSKYEISFPKVDSKILVLPSTENLGRGYTLRLCHLTELAFWEKAEEKMVAIENSVPIDGTIIVESTPNGVGNYYHKLIATNKNYTVKNYGWWWGYSEEEIETIKSRMNNPMKFAQEYLMEFLATGRSVFDQNVLKKLRDGCVNLGDKFKSKTGSEEQVHENRGLRVYIKPQPDDIFVAGVDISEGVEGGDYSVVTIFNRRTGEESAFYRGLCSPDKLADMLNIWGRMFNNALMVIEINNHGLTTMSFLKKLMYPAIYFRPSQFDTIGTKYSDRMGWRTTRITRPLLIDDLAQAIRDGLLIIHSKETLDEMTTFIYDKFNNMIPTEGTHDDCIFSAGIAFQGFKVMYDKALDQLDYRYFLPKDSNY